MTDRIRVIEKPIPVDEPFYGFRYRREIEVDGTETIHVTPLTEEDLKYPQEGDRVTHTIRHNRLYALLWTVCSSRLANEANRYVSGDLLLDLGLADRGLVAPDIAIIRGQRPPDVTATVRVPAMAEEVEMVFEITSPSTRHLDFGFRLERFHEGRIKRVIIIDAANPEATAVMGLRVLDWTPNSYAPASLTAPSRVWVDPVRLWLCIEDNDLVLRGEDLTVIGDYAMLDRQLSAERQHAVELARAAELERQRALDAEQIATEATQAAALERQRAHEAEQATVLERQRAHEAEQAAELERQRADSAEAAYQALLERLRARGISLNGS